MPIPKDLPGHHHVDPTTATNKTVKPKGIKEVGKSSKAKEKLSEVISSAKKPVRVPGEIGSTGIAEKRGFDKLAGKDDEMGSVNTLFTRVVHRKSTATNKTVKPKGVKGVGKSAKAKEKLSKVISFAKKPVRVPGEIGSTGITERRGFDKLAGKDDEMGNVKTLFTRVVHRKSIEQQSIEGLAALNNMNLGDNHQRMHRRFSTMLSAPNTGTSQLASIFLNDRDSLTYGRHLPHEEAHVHNVHSLKKHSSKVTSFMCHEESKTVFYGASHKDNPKIKLLEAEGYTSVEIDQHDWDTITELLHILIEHKEEKHGTAQEKTGLAMARQGPQRSRVTVDKKDKPKASHAAESDMIMQKALDEELKKNQSKSKSKEQFELIEAEEKIAEQRRIKDEHQVKKQEDIRKEQNEEI